MPQGVQRPELGRRAKFVKTSDPLDGRAPRDAGGGNMPANRFFRQSAPPVGVGRVSVYLLMRQRMGVLDAENIGRDASRPGCRRRGERGIARSRPDLTK